MQPLGRKPTVMPGPNNGSDLKDHLGGAYENKRGFRRDSNVRMSQIKRDFKLKNEVELSGAI